MERFAHLAQAGQRVLVTGGSGFIGSNVVAFYDGAGAEVLNLDRVAPPEERYARLWRDVDLTDEGRLTRLVREFRPDLVLHLAARTDLDERSDIGGYSANVAGVRNLLRAMEGVGSLQRAIITSTQLVCRLGYLPKNDHDYNPHTSYGQSKVATERLTRAWQDAPCPWTLVRPTSIWGPGFGQPYKPFFLAVAKRRYLHPRGANPLRSFGFVGNGVYQLASLVRAPVEQVAGKTFYMADYQAVRIRDWANLIREEMGVSKLREVPLGALRAAARVGDVATKLGVRRFPLTSFRLQNMLSDNVVDMSDVERIVGALPYSLEEGVRITVNWLREIGAVRATRGGGGDGRHVMADRLLADG
jgi:nucleoside-diphosphate-sugar epimerase